MSLKWAGPSGRYPSLSEIAHPKDNRNPYWEAHLEFFKDRKEIAKGKLQIADGMPAGGLLLVPADPLSGIFYRAKSLCALVKEQTSVLPSWRRKDSLTFEANFLSDAIDLPVTGKYNATNAMIAAYVALQEGVSEEAIRASFKGLELTKNRTEWKKAGNGADILSDVYNANPTAMRLILETFSTIPANSNGRTLAVFADMKELGEQSIDLHNQMILSLSPDVLDTVIFYGQDIADLAQLASQMFPLGHVYYFKKTAEEDQFEDLVKQVKESLKEQDQILIKGSNSMNLAKLVEELENGE
ncbi:MAG: glutamate ligase domain-containing protein [Streptococcus sp.]